MGQRSSKVKLGVFHHSVRNGNIEKVKELLTEHVPLEDQDDVFGTALHEAVCFDRLEVAELLIQHKADVNALQKHVGDTPLCVASRKGFLPLVELLVRHGAKINQPGAQGGTPLHCALENKHESVAQYLIGAGASVNILDNNGMSSLHIACKNLCKQSIELILSSNTSTTSTSATNVAGPAPVATTAASTTLNLHDAHRMTPLMYVCQAGDAQLDLAEFLLQRGARTRYDAGKSAPLHVTSSIEVAKLLLAQGADVNARDESYATPLHIACSNINGAELVTLFLENRADLAPHDSPTRSTPLHCACRQGAFRNAQLLLMAGASPNAIDIQKNTPLHIASKLGYSGIVQLLIEHHADPNLLNAEGLTPSQLALYADD